MKPLIFCNIYKDKFVTFGGLITPQVFSEELGRNSYKTAGNINSLVTYFSGKGKEPQIQGKIETFLDVICEANSFDSSYAPYFKKRDIYITSPNVCIIEVKHNKFDPPKELDDLTGSPTSITAVQQLFKYLIKSKAEVGILTDGRNFRFYHCSDYFPSLSSGDVLKRVKSYTFEPYLEFAVEDIVRAGEKKHFNLFLSLLLEKGCLKLLIDKSTTQSKKTEQKLYKELTKELFTALEKDETFFEDLLVYTASLGALRVLEDHGVFPEHPRTHTKKDELTLLRDRAFKKAPYQRAILEFLDGKYIKISGKADFPFVKTFDGRIKIDVSKSCKRTLSNSKIKKEVENISSYLSNYDCSHIDWSFWALLYQINSNKKNSTKYGRYYTHPEIISNIVDWYVHKEQRSTKGKKNQPIYDPCVGSGNMLRTFLPFAHYIVPSAPNAIEAAEVFVKSKLMGSDIDSVALWVCKLSLSTAIASRYTPLINPNVFHMDVFNTNAWKEVIQKNTDGVSIVSNPPWKRPKFQLNYMFKEVFQTVSLPKVGTGLEDIYSEFKKIVTFGKNSTSQYYKIWENYTKNPHLYDGKEIENLSNEYKKFVEKHNSKLDPIEGTETLGGLIQYLNLKKSEVDSEKAKYSESYEVSTQPEKVLKDKSCASMFLSRMIKSIPEFSRFAIVQPDSFFVGDTDERREHFKLIEKYFCFSKNRIPGTQTPLFSEVHTGTKFGVVLGTKGLNTNSKKAIIFETDLPASFIQNKGMQTIATTEVKLDKEIYTRYNNYCMMPIFDNVNGHKSLMNWIKKNKPILSEPAWHEGINQSGSRNWNKGKSYKVASGKTLKKSSSKYLFTFYPKSKTNLYESRVINSSRIDGFSINKERLFVVDVNRNAPTRHSCLLCGKIPKGLPVFNNILWIIPKNISSKLKKINSDKFENALYTICKSNHINAKALNWLGL